MWDSCRKIWVKRVEVVRCVRMFARVSVFKIPGMEGRNDVFRQTHVAGSFTIQRVGMYDSMAQAQLIIVRSMLLHLPQPFLQSSSKET
jgi:hypothetical protein